MTKGESSVKEPRQEIVPEIDGKNVRTLALATKMWDSCRGLLKVPPGTKQRSKEGPFGHNRRRTKKSVVKTASSLFQPPSFVSSRNNVGQQFDRGRKSCETQK